MSSDTSPKQVYRVTIFNQTLSIASSTSPDEFHRIAAQIDQLMAMIASKSGTADGARVGVLTAMHLADRLHQMEQKAEARLKEAGQFQHQAQASAQLADDLEAQLASVREALAQSSQEAEALRVDLARAVQQQSALQAELGAAQGNIAVLHAEMAGLQRTLAQAQAELEAERASIGRNAGRLHSLLERALDPTDTPSPEKFPQASVSPQPTPSPNAASVSGRPATFSAPPPSDSPQPGSLFSFDDPDPLAGHRH